MARGGLGHGVGIAIGMQKHAGEGSLDVLTATRASFALTGQDINFKSGVVTVLARGTFTLTGQAAQFLGESDGTAPNAPTLTWTSTDADNTPNFDVGLPSGAGDSTDAAVDDVVTIEYDDAGNSFGSPTTYLTHTLDSGDIAGGTINLELSVVTNGDYEFRAFFTRDATSSSFSSTESVTIAADAVAPTISTLSPLDDATGTSTGGTLTVTFDEDVQFADTVDISIHLTSDDSLVEAFDETDIGTKISIGSDTLIISTTSPLANSTEYYVLIDAVAIEDLAGNAFAGISSTTAWSFTTGTAKSYAYLNNSGDLGGSTSFSLDLGAESSSKTIIIGVHAQNASLATATVTVDGVSLGTPQIYDDGSGSDFPAAIFSGTISSTGSKTVSLSISGGTGGVLIIHGWKALGLSSSTAAAVGGGHSFSNPTISVQQGDLMFGISRVGGATPPSWSGATEVPDGVHPDNSYGAIGAADWTIDFTNASFIINSGASNSCAATFR